MSTTLMRPKFSGAKFREARLAAGIALRDPRWGYSAPEVQIAHFQSGRHTPSLRVARRLAKVLGIDPIDLYDFVEATDDYS